MLNFPAPSVNDVQQAIEYIYPLVYHFRKERSREDEILLERKQNQGRKRKLACVNDSEESVNQDSDDSSE